VTARRNRRGSPSVGVQNRTVLADNAVKCSGKTAMILVITAEILGSRQRRYQNNNKTMADVGCFCAANNRKLAILANHISIHPFEHKPLKISITTPLWLI
jgi:hypothetical protein